MSSFSIPFLSLFILLRFYILITTAQHHFSLVTTKLTSHLNLFPSMDTVMFLSLGNSTLDIFPLIALRADQCRIGFGAILSTGTFVSVVVIGFVAVYVVPFVVYPLPFVREVLFYLTTATFLFYVYLSVEIFLWQAVRFIGFYLFFVRFVFYMDLGMADRIKKSSKDLVGQKESDSNDVKVSESSIGEKCASFGLCTEGVIALDVLVGRNKRPTIFVVIFSQVNFNVLLGREWIHKVGVVPSTVHQKLFIWNNEGQLKVVEANQSSYESYVPIAEQPNKTLALIAPLEINDPYWVNQKTKPSNYFMWNPRKVFVLTKVDEVLAPSCSK